MKNMTLQNIANACKGRLVCKEEQKDFEIKGAVLDSRLVEERRTSRVFDYVRTYHSQYRSESMP